MEGNPHRSAAGLSRRQFGTAAAGLAAALGTPEARGNTAGSEPPGRETGVGLALSHEQFRTPQLVGFAEQAEQAGFGPVWASDHLQPWQDDQGHSMFPWLTLALIGERTHRMHFGTGVTCPTYRHHPSNIAQAFASLALLSPGRVYLGVGTGEALNELAGTGHWGRYAERHDRLVEAITLIRQLWTGRRLSFAGRYFQTDQLKLYDLPERPPPVYVAAAGPKSARLAGQHGDGWITQYELVFDPKLRAAFDDGARAAGKNPDAMPKWAEVFAVVGDQQQIDRAAELWRFIAAPSDDEPNPVTIQQKASRVPLATVVANWTTGTDPDVHIRTVRRFLDAGVTPIMHFPQHDPREAIDFYRAKVFPRLP
ncbi:F420-dependent hydroxymycolic acid dehydrogenase [Amycolatopsis taiwanensis]|uniref:F420-dependent hydroxymycolic acid dehydrogenase n=1 Tax=Amycolatopsis taiwanensis TaxID=342230 RepID=A0A9W6VEX4_9PSEU|nr:F420-dependent hydroxymycolic acid dehydrogenase [Amycolatopsis taiwanensis]GLY64269.1 F420-dependent hydroxymycolic acid dehydrogenase [Amycolatopsis taiwanensis]